MSLPLVITETENCWDFLASTSLPIFIYGMGDGAIKIMNVFEDYNIAVAGFFASDEFVRGHSFQGHLVHKLSEIEAVCEDFIIVLAFAASYQKLYDHLIALSEKHTIIAPDVPVAGNGLFTYEYYLENLGKFEQVYELLADEQSKAVYTDIINFKISGKISYLNNTLFDENEIFESLITLGDNEVYADLGAFNGDTVLEFLQNTNSNYKHIYALEPNPKNFRRLLKNTDGLEKFTAINAAAWSCETTLGFSKGVGRMTKIELDEQNKTDATSVDNIATEDVTFLKLDVEGAEREAILGAKKQISTGCKIISALYHRNEDLFDIPLLIHEINPDYKFFIRHKLYIPAWETNLYAKI